MAKISIIIPVYNAEAYLAECMDSVIRQTLKDIEIICVNDGSTDSSLSILQHYAKEDSRIIIIEQENSGYGKAMNVGLDHATGEYIGIVEADDHVPLAMYEDLYLTAQKNSLDMIKADFYCFSTHKENGSLSLTYKHLDDTGKYYNKVFDPSTDPQTLHFVMNTWSGIYRRKFLNENHIRHNETPGAAFQDNGFFFQTFLYAKRAMLVDTPYYMHRSDNPASLINSRDNVYCGNIEFDYIREFLMEQPEVWEKFKYMYHVKKYDNYMLTLARIRPDSQKEYIQRFSREFKRAEDQGELDFSEFSSEQQELLRFLIKDANGYYTKFCLYNDVQRKLEDKLKKAEKELRDIKSSTTYKAGRIVMFLPIAIKKLLKKFLK